LLSPTTGYSFQAGNNSVKPTYTISIKSPSHDPAVVVNRVPYSLKYEDLFQPAAMQLGKTATSRVIGRATSANITPVHAQTHASMKLPSIGRSITSLSGRYVVNLTNNMTALNLANKMITQQGRNMTIPSIANSSFKVIPPTNISALK
jgi:hypothetical protein